LKGNYLKGRQKNELAKVVVTIAYTVIEQTNGINRIKTSYIRTQYIFMFHKINRLKVTLNYKLQTRMTRQTRYSNCMINHTDGNRIGRNKDHYIIARDP
jgi:hypothetical protein